jgi:RimJ/RimL family protein N-acetyltransferase
VTVILRATGIELRPLTVDDAAAHHAAQDEFEIAAFEFPRASTIDDVVEAIEAWRVSWAGLGPVRNFGLFDSESGGLCGNVELRLVGEHRVNLSYLVFPAYRRRGIATSAARLALVYAAREMGADVATLEVLTWNVASIGVARGLGGREIGREPSDGGGTFVVFEVSLQP